MSFDNQNIKKYLLIGGGVALASAALYYMSKDDTAVEYIPSKHTVEELRKVIHEIYVEGVATYQ